MKLKQIMAQNVVTIHPTDTLQAAARIMRDRDVGFLPVYEGNELIGVLSDRDLVVRALAEGMNPNTMLSKSLLTTPVISCFEDQSVDDAVQLMHENQIRRLVILDRKTRQLVGVISLGDLATHVSEKISGEVLQHVSVP
jgi:CBS domain-containing protein